MTPKISTASATIEISTRVKKEKPFQGSARLVTSICDTEGSLLSRAEAAHSFDGEAGYSFEEKLTLENPKLSSPDRPALYKTLSEVYQGAQLVDQYFAPFVVRTSRFNADSRFSLNGQLMKLKGVCSHHDLGALGAAFLDPDMERRLLLLKDMGCNVVRTNHNQPAPRLLDMCDRLGFLVMDEAFDVWNVNKRKYDYHSYFDQWRITDLRDMIYRDRNHPSIILWSIGNEIPEKGRPEGVATAKLLTRTVHEANPPWPVTCAIDSIEKANRSGFADVLDVVRYNGGGGYSFQYNADHSRYPQRKICGREAPHTAQTRGFYMSGENYCSSYDTGFIRFASEGSWKLVTERPFVAGEFRWVGIDSLGEPIPHWRFDIPSRELQHFWPARAGDFGTLVTCGFTKGTDYFYQSRWNEKPMLHIFPHWTWKGEEGRPMFILCYTNCEAVELFLNGHLLGIQHSSAPPACHLMWQAAYQPGVLRAIGWNDGQQICEHEIRTVGKPATVALKSARTWIQADKRDLAHITAAITDKDWNLVPNASQHVHFEVAGGEKLVGVDNGDPLSHATFKPSERKAFQGLCLAIVQSAGQRGQVNLAPTSARLAPAKLSIESRS